MLEQVDSSFAPFVTYSSPVEKVFAFKFDERKLFSEWVNETANVPVLILLRL